VRTGDKDRRCQALALTGKGCALVPRLAVLADENDDKFFLGHLAAGERQTVETAMRDIVRRHSFKSVPIE
jgi:DNA-binding MarR family transcriptional regulator